jgi:hypothetical protein
MTAFPARMVTMAKARHRDEVMLQINFQIENFLDCMSPHHDLLPSTRAKCC